MLQAGADTGDFQDTLFLLEIDTHVRGNGVGQAPGLVDTGEGGQHLRRHLLAQVDVFFKLGDGRAQQALDFAFGDVVAKYLAHAGDGETALVVDTVHNRPVTAFNQHFNGAVRQLEQLQDVGHGAHLVDVIGTGIIVRGIALGHQQHLLVVGHGKFKGLYGLLPPHEQGQHHVGINHHIAQG